MPSILVTEHSFAMPAGNVAIMQTNYVVLIRRVMWLSEMTDMTWQ